MNTSSFFSLLSFPFNRFPFRHCLDFTSPPSSDEQETMIPQIDELQTQKEETEKERNIICNLPTELLLNIFSFLPPSTLLICRLVCRSWSELACHNSIWTFLCFQSYSLILFPPEYSPSSFHTNNTLTSIVSTTTTTTTSLNTKPTDSKKLNEPITTYITFYHAKRYLDHYGVHYNQHRCPFCENPTSLTISYQQRKHQQKIAADEDEGQSQNENEEMKEKPIKVINKCEYCIFSHETEFSLMDCFCPDKHTDNLYLCQDCKATYVCFRLMQGPSTHCYCSRCHTKFLLDFIGGF